MEALVILEFPCGKVPGPDEADDAEEGPPDTYSEAPDHSLNGVMELVHHCS